MPGIIKDKQKTALQNYKTLLEAKLRGNEEKYKKYYTRDYSTHEEESLTFILKDEIERINEILELAKKTQLSNQEQIALLYNIKRLGLDKDLFAASYNLSEQHLVEKVGSNLGSTVHVLRGIVKSSEHTTMQLITEDLQNVYTPQFKEKNPILKFALELTDDITAAKTESHQDAQWQLAGKIESISADARIPEADKQKEYVKAMIYTYAKVEKESLFFTSALVDTLKDIMIFQKKTDNFFDKPPTSLQKIATDHAKAMNEAIEARLSDTPTLNSKKIPTGVAAMIKIKKDKNLLPVEKLAAYTKISMERLDTRIKRTPELTAFYQGILEGNTDAVAGKLVHKRTQPKPPGN